MLQGPPARCTSPYVMPSSRDLCGAAAASLGHQLMLDGEGIASPNPMCGILLGDGDVLGGL